MPHHQLSRATLAVWTVFALFSAMVNARAFHAGSGIHVIPHECEGRDLLRAEYAILDASRLAIAGRFAARSYNQAPFNMFFNSTPQNSHTVANIYQRIIHSQQGKGDFIGVTCQDKYNHCTNSSTNGTEVMPAYSVQFLHQHRTTHIVLCTEGLALPRDPVPCTENPGRISLGWLMVHVMSGLTSISGEQIMVGDDKAYTARDVMEEASEGRETIGNANAYGFLGVWAWALGLGGPPQNRHNECLDNAGHGDIDASLGHSAPVSI